jgi:hypothetical protein
MIAPSTKPMADGGNSNLVSPLQHLIHTLSLSRVVELAYNQVFLLLSQFLLRGALSIWSISPKNIRW